MSEERKRFTWRTSSGQTIVRHGIAVTPLSQALVFRCPRGGCLWNRPRALVVEQDGEKRRIPVVDATRLVQLALYGLSVVFVLVGISRMVRQRRNHE